MSKLVVTLEEADLVDLQGILLDDDREAALEFLRTRIAPQIPEKGTDHCDSSRRNPYLLKPARSGSGT